MLWMMYLLFFIFVKIFNNKYERALRPLDFFSLTCAKLCMSIWSIMYHLRDKLGCGQRSSPIYLLQSPHFRENSEYGIRKSSALC